MVTLSVFDAAREAPERLAVIAGTSRLTFGELAKRVERRLAELSAAGALDESGSKPLAFVATPTLACLETLLAAFAAGTPALLLHARSSEPEREQLIVRAGAHTEAARRETTSGAPPSAGFEPERIAVLVPTSGTTGSPRLARLSHRALLAAADASSAHLGVEDDRWLLALPLAHVGGLMIAVRSLVARTAVVLFDPGGPLLARLDVLAAAIRESEVTLLSLVPTVLDRLLEPPSDWHPPASLRAVLVGGAACPTALLERAHARRIPVLTTYGLTETCAQVATRAYSARFEPPARGTALAPAGVPLSNAGVRVTNGSVEVRGPALFSGYAGEPESDPRGGWFTTRDRGSITPEGELLILGRTSDLIITGGENVDPTEIEAVLASIPGVLASCVLGTPDATFGEIVTALLVVEPDGPRSLEALAPLLRPRLASFKLPRKLVVVPELPTLPSGKLDRRTARERYAERMAGVI
jgi:O-succinylbenzoic acid--CoA ligase